MASIPSRKLFQSKKYEVVVIGEHDNPQERPQGVLTCGEVNRDKDGNFLEKGHEIVDWCHNCVIFHKDKTVVPKLLKLCRGGADQFAMAAKYRCKPGPTHRHIGWKLRPAAPAAAALPSSVPTPSNITEAQSITDSQIASDVVESQMTKLPRKNPPAVETLQTNKKRGRPSTLSDTTMLLQSVIAEQRIKIKQQKNELECVKVTATAAEIRIASLKEETSYCHQIMLCKPKMTASGNN